MNYYKQGDAANAEEIKAAFEKLDVTSNADKYNYKNGNMLYFTAGDMMHIVDANGSWANIIKTHPDYKELELPVEPKFKAEDRIVSKSDKSTIYRIIDLHEERMEYIVEIEHKDFHESCPWIAFEDQDDYELAPKSHYDIANLKPFDKVLVRDGDYNKWCCNWFSHYSDEGGVYRFVTTKCGYAQCIPFNEDTEHLLGTTDMCDEQYINW